MSETILLGRGGRITQLQRKEWEARLSQVPERHEMRLRFMSREHHLVRYFVVRELPRVGAPIEPQLISQELGLNVDQVLSILDDLERNLFFLVRNERGSVSWAYPVTVDRTPHRLTFSTGERLYGA
jgi:hypothetical protein